MLDDDDTVAHAYLLERGAKVGDVWLYNVGGDPEAVDWRDKSALPFRNPASHCTGEALPRLREDSKVTCRWTDRGVTVSVEGLVWARLEKGPRPGWSRCARVAGPLARPLGPEAAA